MQLSDRVRRVRGQVCEPIPPSEIAAHFGMNGEFVRPSEYATLCAMDDAFCLEMGKELKAFQERQTAEAEEAAKKKRGKKGG